MRNFFIKINGMGCPRCENKVKEALEKEYKNVNVSFKDGSATFSSENDVSIIDVKNVIYPLNYEVIYIKEK